MLPAVGRRNVDFRCEKLSACMAPSDARGHICPRRPRAGRLQVEYCRARGASIRVAVLRFLRKGHLAPRLAMGKKPQLRFREHQFN
jgi:hypothetical protein